MLKKLPQFVYVAIREPGESEWLTAELTALDAIEGDGPTRVGTYRLIAESDLHKVVVSKSRRRKHGQ